MHAWKYPGARAAPRRTRARGRVHAGLGEPRGQPAAAAGAARRHHGGGRLSLADPAPLRRPGGGRARRRAALFHAVERRPGRGARASRARTRSCPARPAASSARRAPRRMAGLDRIIGFDMGGTSTDVALYAGAFERAFETEVAGVRMRAPMMAINTVAAGGGSILHFDGARFRVGPDSAGADPGPGLLPPRRPADGDRRQCLRRQDPAGAFPGDLRAGRRRSRSTPRSCATKFAALAEEIAQATGEHARRTRGRRGLPAHRGRQHGERDQAGLGAEGPRRRRASRCNASAAPAASTPAWWPTSSAWRRCSSTRSPACCRPTAWASPTRPCCASRRSRCPLEPRRAAGAARAGRPAGGARRPTALRGAGRRPDRDPHRAPAASALCRHRGGADRAARATAATMRRATSPRRIARASASPRRSAALVVEAVAVEAIAPGETDRASPASPRARAARRSRSTRSRC